MFEIKTNLFSSSKRGDRDNCRGSGRRHRPRNLCNMASARDCQAAAKGKVSSEQQNIFKAQILKGNPLQCIESKSANFSGNWLRKWNGLRGRRPSWPREGSVSPSSTPTPVCPTRSGASCDTLGLSSPSGGSSYLTRRKCSLPCNRLQPDSSRLRPIPKKNCRNM